MTPPTGRRILVWLPAAVLIAGLLTTGLVSRLVKQQLDTNSIALFEDQHLELAEEIQSAINERLNLLNMVASAMQPGVNRQKMFNQQSGLLLRRFPDVLTLDRIATVPAAERGFVEQQLSSESGQYITFGDWRADGQTVTAATDNQYQAVVQVAERMPTAITLGLVVTSVPHWRQPLETALLNEKTSATAQTDLQRNGAQQTGIRLFRACPQITPDQPRELISVALSPHILIRDIVPGNIRDDMQATVFDLDQHLKLPLFASPKIDQPLPGLTIRSALSVADREWILTTIPNSNLIYGESRRTRELIWLIGAAGSLLMAALVWWLGKRIRFEMAARAEVRKHLSTARRTNENGRIEKDALKRALNDSEQRSRDLVELAGGFIADLDEAGRIGYISPQILALIGQPPGSLTQLLMTDIVVEEDQGRLTQAMAGCRRSQQLTRIDLILQHTDDYPVPVTLRIKLLIDTLNGYTGFRLSGISRPGQPEEKL
ncbi:hypothetical protein ACTXGQ_14330 [Marinobacter sp. 1Y8]